MAIKGYLSEINFVELLKVVSNYNGKLRVWNITDNKQYECFFYNQSVISLNFCGKSVTAREVVNDVFFELLTDCKSYYAFEDDSSLPEHNSPIVSVDELLDFSVFETPEANDDLLPHIHTKFETVNKFDFVLQGELADFWRDSIKLLHKGCSGYDLCIELGLEERLVRQNLYKLRTTGLIKPVRMFNAANSLAKSRIIKQNSVNFANKINNGQQIRPVINGKAASVNRDVIPPDFLLKERQPLPLPETDLFVGNISQVQNPPAAHSINWQENQSFTEAEVSENSSDIQFSLNEFSVAAHSVNISTSGPDTANEQSETDNESLLPPKRSSLIKRMLNSLFRG